MTFTRENHTIALMNSYTTNKNKSNQVGNYINFADVDFLTVSTVQSEVGNRRVMVDRGVVVIKDKKDVEIFGKDVNGFSRGFAKWQHNKNN